MITTLAISFQHLFIVLIILGLLVGLPAYLILKVQKSNKEEKQLLSNFEINTIGDESITNGTVDEDLMKKIEKYGNISDKANLILYIITFIFLAVCSAISTVNNRTSYKLDDTAYLLGTILGGTIRFLFYISIFTLMFNPIRRLYKRYRLFSNGSIDAVTFKKFKKRSKVWTIILSIICIPLSLGIFGLLLIPHYIFSSNLKKI